MSEKYFIFAPDFLYLTVNTYNMNYIEVTLIPQPMSEETCDILAAMLAPLGYDSFSTEEDCLKAYVLENQYDACAIKDVIAQLPVPDTTVDWHHTVIETQNWNQVWEEAQDFPPIPVTVGDETYQVHIKPNMSFGSGYHETTSQLVEEIQSLIPNPSSLIAPMVLDMGTGTGILAIVAAICGAEHVRAIEIDDRVAENAIDNVLLNGLASKVRVECGDASLLTEGPTYSLVIANINRNVLTADMARYVSVMLPGASLLMSGFYEEDVPVIRQCAEALGLVYQYHRNREGWVVIRFIYL